MTSRSARFLAALIRSLGEGHSLRDACTCPEHRIVAAWRRGDREPPQRPDLGLDVPRADPERLWNEVQRRWEDDVV